MAWHCIEKRKPSRGTGRKASVFYLDRGRRPSADARTCCWAGGLAFASRPRDAKTWGGCIETRARMATRQTIRLRGRADLNGTWTGRGFSVPDPYPWRRTYLCMHSVLHWRALMVYIAWSYILPSKRCVKMPRYILLQYNLNMRGSILCICPYNPAVVLQMSGWYPAPGFNWHQCMCQHSTQPPSLLS